MIAAGIAIGVCLIGLGIAGAAHRTLLRVIGIVLAAVSVLDAGVFRIRTRPSLDGSEVVED